MKKVLVFTAGTLLSFHYCSPPLQSTLTSGNATITGQFADMREKVPFRGSGKVVFILNGERQTGWFDVRYDRDRSFTATFYTPLGAIIGSITARNDSGHLVIQGKKYTLSAAQTLDSLSLPWSRGLQFKDLTTLLCGKIIPSFPFPQHPPDGLKSEGMRNIYVWRDAKSEISAIFSRHLGRLKRIVLQSAPNGGLGYSIIYDSFFEGFARYISFKVDDGNYFSIQYERIVKDPLGL